MRIIVFSEVKCLRIPARRATFWVVVVPRWLCIRTQSEPGLRSYVTRYVQTVLSRMLSLGTMYILHLTRKMNTCQILKYIDNHFLKRHHLLYNLAHGFITTCITMRIDINLFDNFHLWVRGYGIGTVKRDDEMWK